MIFDVEKNRGPTEKILETTTLYSHIQESRSDGSYIKYLKYNSPYSNLQFNHCVDGPARQSALIQIVFDGPESTYQDSSQFTYEYWVDHSCYHKGDLLVEGSKEWMDWSKDSLYWLKRYSGLSSANLLRYTKRLKEYNRFL